MDMIIKKQNNDVNEAVGFQLRWSWIQQGKASLVIIQWNPYSETRSKEDLIKDWHMELKNLLQRGKRENVKHEMSRLQTDILGLMQDKIDQWE